MGALTGVYVGRDGDQRGDVAADGGGGREHGVRAVGRRDGGGSVYYGTSAKAGGRIV